MSGSDSAPDRSATVVEKETIKEASSELLTEMPVFKVLMGEVSTVASSGPSQSQEALLGLETG